MTDTAKPPFEFDCQDCGCHVFAFGRVPTPPPVRCGVCVWIAEHVTDPAEAARIRASLREPGADDGLTESLNG
jgi:hypothetical protein